MTGNFDFYKLNRPGSPNTALFYPAWVALPEKSDGDVPDYKISADDLYLGCKTLFTRTDENRLVSCNDADRTMAIVATSKVMKFKDDINVEILANNEASSFMIYSRSRKGYWDLGANKERISDWIEALNETLARG